MIKFIFDLDGTVTSQETLPLIARHFNMREQINRLTWETIQGNIPFIESFIHRVHILGRQSVSEINDLLGDVPVYPQLRLFIQNNADKCMVATGNLGCWVEKLAAKVGCDCCCSDGLIKDDKVQTVAGVLRKELVVERYKKQGYTVVFVGEGNNDVEAVRAADVSIASGLTHKPADSVLSAADHLVFSEEALCNLLRQFL